MWRAFLPAGLLLLFGGWSGTFVRGASPSAALVGTVALLAFVLPSRAGLAGFGRRGALWLLPIILLIVAGWLRSPVPRAGWVPLVLLPAFLILPGRVAEVWETPERRRWGLLGLTFVIVVLATLSLVAAVRTGEPAREPFGHHLLVVAHLAPLFPLGLYAAASGWRPLRGLGWLAVGTTVAALLATRSVLGIATLLLAFLLVAVVRPRLRRRTFVGLVVGGTLVGLGLLLGGGASGLGDLVGSQRTSWLARLSYWEAGWAGWRERPWFGWGLGSTPWTIAEHLRPRPGIQPAGEVVGDLHSLPIQLARELGILGLIAFLLPAVLWLGNRWCEVRTARSGAGLSLAPIGLCGVGVGALYWLAGVGLGTSGPWIVLGIVAGAALGEGACRPSESRWVRLYVGVAALLLAPSLLARFEYESARRVALAHGEPASDEVVRHLDRSVRLDPAFPLYRARRAAASGGEAIGVEALRSQGNRIPSLWLEVATVLEEGSVRRSALHRASDLDPWGWSAPFELAAGVPGAADAASLGGRAVLLEPRLLASTLLRERPGFRIRIAREVRSWPGVEAGLREALSEDLVAPWTGRQGGGDLTLTLDETVPTSVSLHLFRRPPWPRDLVSVPVDLDRARVVEIPSATLREATAREAFTPR